MYKNFKVTALILAAGMGQRMGAGKNKLLIEIMGKSVLAYTLESFDKNSYVDEIIIAAAKNETEEIKGIAASADLVKPCRVIAGGKNRQKSSENAVFAADDGIVLIHDGARALITDEIINSVIAGAEEFGAAAPGIGVTDTVKRVQNGIITETLNRDELCLIQTPQGFKTELIKAAHLKAIEDGFAATDDCALMERMGRSVKLTEGSADNIKLTFAKDMVRAEEIIKARDRKLKFPGKEQ